MRSSSGAKIIPQSPANHSERIEHTSPDRARRLYILQEPVSQTPSGFWDSDVW